MAKRSKTTVIFKKTGTSVSSVPMAGVNGSTRAGVFLRDAVNGTDSVDIITIGDSNTGFQSAGVPASAAYAYGYTCGLHRALGCFMGIPMYATALIPTALESGSSSGLDRGDPVVGVNPLGTNVKCNWPGTADSGATGATGPVSRLEHRVGQSDANAIALKTNLGYSTETDNPDVGFGKLLPRFTGFLWDGAFVAAGNTYTSEGNKNYVYLKASSPILNAQSQPSLQYRCVYGKFASGSGTFRTTGLILTGFVATEGPITPTSGGSANNWYGTSTVTFTGPTVTNGVAASDVCASWDNISQGDPTVGPFAGLWHSICRLNSKGYAVNNYIYQGGAQSIHLRNRLESNGGVLDSYLKEIAARQIAASGSGRAIVWINVGINGPESGASFITNITACINKLIERWEAVGNNANNLAFIISASHPAPAVSTWSADRATTVAAAATVATNNASKGVVAVDVAQFYSAQDLLTGGVSGSTMYDAAGQAHLRGFNDQANGYDAVATAMISAVCSYV